MGNLRNIYASLGNDAKRWDILPADDLGIRAGIRKLYNLEALPDRKTTEHFGQKWKPYWSIASWYLWRSLEIKPV